jgi:predicted transcriptional regulator
MPEDLVNRHIDIDDLPRHVDQTIGVLARLRGMTKKAIVREALVEYVKNHKADIQTLLKR